MREDGNSWTYAGNEVSCRGQLAVVLCHIYAMLDRGRLGSHCLHIDVLARQTALEAINEDIVALALLPAHAEHHALAASTPLGACVVNTLP